MKGIVNNTLLTLVVSASLVGSANAMDQVKEYKNNFVSYVKSFFPEEVQPEVVVPVEVIAQPKTYLEQAKELMSKSKTAIVNTPASAKAALVSAKDTVKAAGSSVKNKALEAGKSASEFAKKSYNVSAQQLNNNKGLIAASATGAAAALAYKFGVVGKVKAGAKAAYNTAKNNKAVVAAVTAVAAVPAVYMAVTHKAALAENAHNVVPAVKAAYNYALTNKASILAKVAAFTVSAAATFGITEIASK